MVHGPPEACLNIDSNYTQIYSLAQYLLIARSIDHLFLPSIFIMNPDSQKRANDVSKYRTPYYMKYYCTYSNAAKRLTKVVNIKQRKLGVTLT